MENMVNAIELQENELSDVTGGGFMDYFDKVKDFFDIVGDVIDETIGEKVDQFMDLADLVINGTGPIF